MADAQTHFINNLESACLAFEKLKKSTAIHVEFEKIVIAIENAFRSGHKVLIAGNGGSAADAQHFAAELVARFYLERQALPVIALTTDTSALTAIGNDYGFDSVFARQLEALGVKGDVFVGISTSGNSKNIIAALNVARARGLLTVGLTGESGGLMREGCDLCICVPSKVTPRIQEMHLYIEHALAEEIESRIATRP